MVDDAGSEREFHGEDCKGRVDEGDVMAGAEVGEKAVHGCEAERGDLKV